MNDIQRKNSVFAPLRNLDPGLAYIATWMNGQDTILGQPFGSAVHCLFIKQNCQIWLSGFV